MCSPMTAAPSEYRDVNGFYAAYPRLKDSISKSEKLSDSNKQLILRYLEDAEAGKTIKKGAKRKVGIGRCIKVAGILQFAAEEWFEDVTLSAVTQTRMDDVIRRLENGELLNRYGKPYEQSSAVSIKKILAKFWRWMADTAQSPQAKADYFDTSVSNKPVDSMSREEIESLVNSCAGDAEKQAVLSTLFDAGLRISEALNIRHRDISKIPGTNVLCLTIRISKTTARPVSIPIATPFLQKWLDSTPNADREGYVFPMSKRQLYYIIKRLGKCVLNRNIHPHLFRDSSVTYYCTRLDRAALCKRYGWSYTSKVPDKYIDWSKIEEKKTAIIVESEDIETLRKKNKDLTTRINLIEEQLSQMREMGEVLDNLSDDDAFVRRIAEAVKRAQQSKKKPEAKP